MLKGWAEHPGGRHHGAHGAVVSEWLGASPEDLLDFSQNINPLGAPEGVLEAARAAAAYSLKVGSSTSALPSTREDSAARNSASAPPFVGTTISGGTPR